MAAVQRVGNIAGCSLHSVYFDICHDGFMHFSERSVDACYRYTLKCSEWLEGIHADDRPIVEATLFDLLAKKIDTASFSFRRLNIDGCYFKLTYNCEVSSSGDHKAIVGIQESYIPEFNQNQHISHQHWITSPYHFYHYKKLLDDMNRLIESNKECTFFYFNISKLKTLVNQYGYDVLDKVYGCIFNSLNDLAVYPICRYQSILGNFVVVVGHALSHSEIEKACDKILYYSQIKSTFNPIVGQCDMSIGVTTLPLTSGSTSPRDILRYVARASEYALKKHQRKWAIHDDSSSSKVNRHFYIEKELRSAIEKNELTVKFQPIINAETMFVSGLEVLSRWESSELGEIYPDEFIPVAESQHLINELGWQVLKKSCQFLKQLPDDSNLCINVNVSVLQLQNIDFAVQALSIVSEHNIKPNKIVFEITESLLLDKNSIASAQLVALSQFGFRLSLDDFGSGYSTLNSLFSLPINQIKLDRETANQAIRDEEAMNYIRFLIDMCQRNGVEFLVEGIENTEMSECYRSQNVHRLQGFYFSKPLHQSDALSFIENKINSVEL